MPFPKPLLKQACVTLISILMAWEADWRYAGLQKIFTEGEAFHPRIRMNIETDPEMMPWRAFCWIRGVI